MNELVIAAGTRHALAVLDVRADERWSHPLWEWRRPFPRYIILHHTASGVPSERTVAGELAYLRWIRNTAPHALPYNFAIVPSGRIYYCNDVDEAHGHTLYFSASTAVCLIGNYDVADVPAFMWARCRRLYRALRSMWRVNERVVFSMHGDMADNATACPGRYARARMERWARGRYA